MFVGGVVVWRLIVAGIGHRSYSGIRRGDGYVDVLRCAQRESGRPQFLVDERAAHPESSFCFSTVRVQYSHGPALRNPCIKKLRQGKRV